MFVTRPRLMLDQAPSPSIHYRPAPRHVFQGPIHSKALLGIPLPPHLFLFACLVFLQGQHPLVLRGYSLLCIHESFLGGVWGLYGKPGIGCLQSKLSPLYHLSSPCLHIFLPAPLMPSMSMAPTLPLRAFSHCPGISERKVLI